MYIDNIEISQNINFSPNVAELCIKMWVLVKEVPYSRVSNNREVTIIYFGVFSKNFIK